MCTFRIVLFLLFALFTFSGTAQSRKAPGEVKKRAGTAESNGIQLAWESFGEEGHEAILLIQGTAAQLTAWPESLCRQLAAQGYRVIRFDNRDAGKSSAMDALGAPDWKEVFPLLGSCDASRLPYSLEDMAGDALGLLDALHIRKAHIVGASMGGAIAQLMAIRHPERTRSLVSIMASSGNPARPAGRPEVLQRMAAPPPANDPDSIARHLYEVYTAIGSPAYPPQETLLMNRIREDISRSWNPEGSARQAAAVLIGDTCDRRKGLSGLKMPVVVIHGEEDPVVPLEAGKEVADTIPGARFIIIPGMGHDLPEALVPGIRNAILWAAKAPKVRN